MKIADTCAKCPQDIPTNNLSKRLENLARYMLHSSIFKWLNHSRREIGQLRSSADDKFGPNQLTEAAQPRIDIGDIEKISSAISSIIDIFHVRPSVSSPIHSSDLPVVRERHCGRSGDRARCE